MNIIMHIDVNNAFLSWEAVNLLNNGYKIDIRNTVSVIGGDKSKRQGVVLSKSYGAKEHGILTGESIFNALRKYKDLKIYKPSFDVYEKESNKLYEFLLNYSPIVEKASIDECYLDYTGMERLFGNPIEFAIKIKQEIYDKFGWTVNIGIGENKICAKMASDFEKPNKVHTLFKNEIETKLWILPVNRLYMIGKETTKKLNELNIFTIKDLAVYDLTILKKIFKSQAITMYNYANGIDNSKVIGEFIENKCISISRTCINDLINKKEIEEHLVGLVNNLCIRLRKMNVYTNVISLILKNNKFETYSCQKKTNNPTNITNILYDEIIILLNKLYRDEPIRLVGISFSNFIKDRKIQTSLFDDVDNSNDEKLEKIMDTLNDKYGGLVIKYARNKEK